MAEEKIIHVPRSDVDGQFVLLRVMRRGVDGTLNLKIEATEGETPYFLRLKQSQVSSLCLDKNYLSERDWEAVLEHVLLQRPLPKTLTLENLSATAAKADKALELTIKVFIEGIVKRLGVLVLSKDQKVELDIIHWTGVAASQASDLSIRLNKAQAIIESQQTRIQGLETQLENLIAERDEAESALYTKFAEIINTKKLKIRDQQTLLASAKVDPKVAAEVRALRDAVPKGIDVTGKSRAGVGRSTGKRKTREDTPASSGVKDEPLISDESTAEEDSEPEGERLRQLTPTPDESEASDSEMTHPPLPTRNAAPRSRTMSAENPPVSKNDVEMQEATLPALESPMTNGLDHRNGVNAAKPMPTEKPGGNVDEDATDDEDDDEL